MERPEASLQALLNRAFAQVKAADAVDELSRITGLSPTQMVQRFGSQSGIPLP